MIKFLKIVKPMKILSINYKKLAFSSFLALFPLNQFSLLASDILLVNNNYDDIEEVKVRRVNKKGNLVVKFCSKLKDYKGFVKVDNQIFNIEDADIIKPRKIVWKDTNLTKFKGDDISINNLLARYKDEDKTEPLRVVDEGSCGAGIFPLLLLGGVVAGVSGGGSSGSTSSN